MVSVRCKLRIELVLIFHKTAHRLLYAYLVLQRATKLHKTSNRNKYQNIDIDQLTNE